MLLAAVSCMTALAGLAPSAARGQAGKLTRPVPEWGVNAAIESDLLRNRVRRAGNSNGKAAKSALATTGASGDSQKLRVLLVGNSYTRFHLLHTLIERLADAAGGPRVEVQVEARGGYSLRLHWKSRATLNKIKSGRYTHVVLQGHSMSAIDHPDQLAEDTERFSAMITAAGSRPVLFETWARKPGTSLYKRHRRVSSFDEMANLIDAAYSGAARKLHVGLAPVGGAFERAWRNNLSVSLWGSDGSHPTLAGSYMAACVLYGAITGRDPRHATWEPYGLDPRTAETIRAIAHASLAETPALPDDSLPVTQALAAKGGGRGGEIVDPVRSQAASAKDHRDGAKPVEAGRVAASIAAMMGRAPGQTEAPDTVPDDAESTESPVEPALPAPSQATPDEDVPVLLLRDVEKASFVGPTDPRASADAPVLSF